MGYFIDARGRKKQGDTPSFSYKINKLAQKLNNKPRVDSPIPVPSRPVKNTKGNEDGQ